MYSLVTQSQYGIRLWKLRVTEAEIKATIRYIQSLHYCHLIVYVNRLQPEAPKQQVRIFMTGDASLQVHAHSYFEVEDKRTGEVVNCYHNMCNIVVVSLLYFISLVLKALCGVIQYIRRSAAKNITLKSASAFFMTILHS